MFERTAIQLPLDCAVREQLVNAAMTTALTQQILVTLLPPARCAYNGHGTCLLFEPNYILLEDA